MTSSMSQADALQAELAETPVDRLLVSEARLLRDSHKLQCFDNAKTKIQNTLREHSDFVKREALQREAYIQANTTRDIDSSPARGSGELHSGADNEIVVVSVSNGEDDVSLSRLNSIRRASLSGVKRVKVSKAVEIPNYDAWVPVIQNHFVDDSDIEPYHPYFGESKRGKDLAKEVYEQMIVDKDIGPFDEPSDGELIQGGRPVPPESLKEIEAFHGLESSRTRAAQRHSILTLTRRGGKISPVWKALSVAFDIVDIRRLRYICDLSERREAETRKRTARLQKSRAHAKEIQRAIGTAREEKRAVLEDINWSVKGPLKYFCFACHQFACHLHEGENVNPMLPIPDHAAETRMIELSRGGRKPTPCSQCCFLLDSEDQDPMGIREREHWTREQIQVLRQAAMMFESDPCSLSIVVSGKTCREVHARLQLPDEATLIRSAVRLSKMPRRSGVATGSDSDEEEPLVRRRRKRGRRRTDKNVSAKKSAPQVSEYGAHHDNEVRKRFRPCDHAGGCFKKNSCICALNELSCEAQCGCNCGRYVQGVKGMKWEAPSEIEVRAGLASKCRLRSWGCNCKTGHCNTSRCECYEDLNACNPDFCKCDCCILPEQVSVRRRQCRSADTITSMHKRTLIGQSAVHGFGLFAGERFAVGDLVGQYCGRVMDPELADKSLRTSQAKKQTYAFELTDSLTVDGGSVGSKVKFINHSADPSTINCGARIERVRGDGRIVLRAIKPVFPGDEFLFNYNILDDEGNDWMIHKQAETPEGEVDSGSGSYSSDAGTDQTDEIAVYDYPDTVSPDVKQEDQEATF